MKKTLVIYGVGLMGGSIGLSVRKMKLPYKVIGIGRNAGRLALAKKRGACHEVSTDPSRVKDADIILICTAFDQIVPTFHKIFPFLKPGAIVSDIGSIKAPILDGVSQVFTTTHHLPPITHSFIGSHPMAGSEKTGAVHSESTLYQGATVALCPSNNASKSSLETLKKFWTSLGARPMVLDPSVHDILVAQTSHLPHVLSGAFVQLVSKLQHRDKFTKNLLAGSFQDMTRISDSDPQQWAEISAGNQKFLIGAIKSYRDILLHLLKIIESSANPKKDWEEFYSAARRGRKTLI